MANLACTFETPIQLASWGNVAHISQLLSADSGDWVLFKADRRAAYKQLPRDPADQGDAIIALRHPGQNRFYCFATSTLIFGLVSDVHRYNAISGLLVALANRHIGIPMV